MKTIQSKWNKSQRSGGIVRTWGLVVLALMAFCISSCNRNEDWTAVVKSDSAIPAYAEIYEMTLDLFYERCFELKVSTGNCICTMESEGEKLAQYQALCDKYGDHGFNGSFLQVPKGIFDERAILNQVTSIEIRSTSSWDADHPAGTLLNEFFSCQYYDNKAFIASHYTEMPWRQKPLEEMTAEDFDLAFAWLHGPDKEDKSLYSSPFMSFYVQKLPATPGNYFLQMTVYVDNGERYDLSIDLSL